MATLTVSIPHLQAYFLIFLRISAILMTLPVFDSGAIPILFKAGLALAMSFLVFPLAGPGIPAAAPEMISFGIGVAAEIFLGALIGMTVKLVFTGVSLAGQLAGFQMGIAIANVFDPATSTQVSLPAQIYNIAAMLIFLVLDVHHGLLRTIVDSFRTIPPLGFRFSGALAERFFSLIGSIFTVAVKVGAPVIVALLLVSVALAIISRTVPQMNIFFVAMPIQIAIGLLFMGISLPFLLYFLKTTFRDMEFLVRHLLTP